MHVSFVPNWCLTRLVSLRSFATGNPRARDRNWLVDIRTFCTLSPHPTPSYYYNITQRFQKMDRSSTAWGINTSWTSNWTLIAHRRPSRPTSAPIRPNSPGSSTDKRYTHTHTAIRNTTEHLLMPYFMYWAMIDWWVRRTLFILKHHYLTSDEKEAENREMSLYQFIPRSSPPPSFLEHVYSCVLIIAFK